MRIVPSYSQQPIETLYDPPIVSTSMPFLERDVYKPLFANFGRNQEWLSKYFDSSKVIGKTNTGIPIYYVETELAFYYYIKNESRVIYAVRCEIVELSNLRAVCQTSLWRDKKYSSTVSVPSWIFFNKLLPKYGSILSDKSQSDDGREFWVRRIGEALLQNLYVYIVDSRKWSEDATKQIKITRILNHSDFDRKWSHKLWSKTDQTYQNLRILITNTPIKE